MIILMLGTGLYFTVRTGFFQLRAAGRIASATLFSLFRRETRAEPEDKGSISRFQAMSASLAACLGTGNIAGVATALTAGGPGAIFWMWVSAFFGMMTGYAENLLGIVYRSRRADGEWEGGAMYVLRRGLSQKRLLRPLARPLAAAFALFCMLAALGMGNMAQANSVAAALSEAFRVPPLVTGAVAALAAGLVTMGGIKRIGRVAERVVPLAAVVYIAAAAAVIAANIAQVPAAFAAILRGAFGFDAAAGGLCGTLMKSAVRQGFRRGIFSNEAGLGSSPAAHAASDIRDPAEQGMWSIFEIFTDTFLMCTLTALALLVSGAYGSGLDGAAMAGAAFAAVFPVCGRALLGITAALLGFSTILGWSHYGAKSAEYLFGRRAGGFYRIVFVFFIVPGAMLELKLVWAVSDIFNALMAVPNLIGLAALSVVVISETRRFEATLPPRAGRARDRRAERPGRAGKSRCRD